MQKKRKNFLKQIKRFLRSKASMILTAFMLGMSNVILEEDRSVNDTQSKTELQQATPEDDFSDTDVY